MKPKSKDKEERIKQALIDIVNEKGLSGVKMSEVAKKAEIAQGTIYIYFKTKTTLIKATYMSHKKIANSSIISNELEEMTFDEALQKLGENYCNYLLFNKKELNFMQQCADSDFLDSASIESSTEFMDNITTFFQKGIDTKLLKDNPIPLIIGIFVGFSKELIQILSYIVDDEKARKILENAFEMCWNAVRR